MSDNHKNKSKEDLKKLAEEFDEQLDNSKVDVNVLHQATEAYRFAIANDIKPGEDIVPSIVIYYKYANWKNWKDLEPYPNFFKEFLKLFKRFRPRKKSATGYYLDKTKFDLTRDGIREATLKVQVHHEKKRKQKEIIKKIKQTKKRIVEQAKREEKEE
jgi:hypothetical protein